MSNKIAPARFDKGRSHERSHKMKGMSYKNPNERTDF